MGKKTVYKWHLDIEDLSGRKSWIEGCRHYADDGIERYEAFDDLYSEVMYANVDLCGYDEYKKNPEKYPKFLYPVKFYRIEGSAKEVDVPDAVDACDDDDYFCGWSFLLDELDAKG